MTLLSRVLGFTRDILFATIFGAGNGMDAFLVAFQIPNFMRRLFAEGAFNQAFVPVFTEIRTQGDHARVLETVEVVAGTLAGTLALITVLGVVGAPVLIYIFAPGFSANADKFHLTVSLLRLTFPYILFISLTACAGGILNSFERFAVPAFTPVLLNICLIGSALFLSPYFSRPITALAVGVFAAGVVQLGFQLPFLARLRLLPCLRWGWFHVTVQRILRLMLPALFGSSVTQINLLLDTILASLLASGSVSWLYYSDRLMEFPLGVFSVALGTVILPRLSAHHATRSPREFSETLDWSLKLLFTMVAPAMVGLFVLAGPLLATLFQYHSFNARDVVLSRYSLMAYAAGLLGFSLVKVLVPGFFARQDTRTPVKCAVRGVLAGITMDLAFVGILVALAFPGPQAGLALATSGGAFVNAGLLYRNLRRDDIYRPGPGWRALTLRLVLANIVMGAVLWWLAGDLQQWLAWGVRQRVLHLVALVAVGLAVYAAVLFAAGLRPKHLK
jgi:putative peptidoglycan lipid II flippase